jgi:hypothetical protein
VLTCADAVSVAAKAVKATSAKTMMSLSMMGFSGTVQKLCRTAPLPDEIE